MSGFESDARLCSPAALRNRQPILETIRPWLPPHGLVLEIASGSGEHVVHFAKATPALAWQPSDPNPRARASIAAWVGAEGIANVHPPLPLDAALPDWPIARADAIICINMAHISPWAATLGLFAGAGRLLPGGGRLFLYGPFIDPVRPLAPSNAAFDADLRARDAAWGLRGTDAVAEVATAHGLSEVAQVAM
ncbi:MAG: DUF938 domain-containing protein, partial [Thermaurantiacus sp.]